MTRIARAAAALLLTLIGSLFLASPGTTYADTPDVTTECVIIPSFYNPATTPVVRVGDCWIPEESPDGGYPAGTQLDNSPVYTDGWVLLVNDSTGDVTWSDTLDTADAEPFPVVGTVAPSQPISAAVRHHAGDATYGHNIFNPGAELDTSQIDDLR